MFPEGIAMTRFEQEAVSLCRLQASSRYAPEIVLCDLEIYYQTRTEAWCVSIIVITTRPNVLDKRKTKPYLINKEQYRNRQTILIAVLSMSYKPVLPLS
jgi:hypothetical protein